MPVRPATLRRQLFSVVAVATMMVVSGRGSADGAHVVTTAQASAVAQRYYPEVRLRKLHLVRPDLIPFPIDFDVFC